MAWAIGLRQIQGVYLFVPYAGMPYDHARNAACHNFLTSPAQHLLFLDSDVIPPPDVVFRLRAHNVPIVSGVYCRRSPPHAIPVMQRNGQWLTSIPDRGLIDVSVVGAGCMLLSRQFLEQIPQQRPGKRWFDWRVDMQGLMPQQECMSEDFTFCNWARKHNIPVKVDCSVRCKHVGMAEADYNRFEPLQTIAG
jgi:hypothetical protein